jgi:hypothetical protein
MHSDAAARRFVCRASLALAALMTPCPSTAAEGAAEIQSYAVHITLDARSHNSHIARVTGALRRVGFELRVLPEFDAAGAIEGWEVGLYDGPDSDRNLLAPVDTWHGMQPFILAAGDMTARSAEHGDRLIRSPGFECRIEILSQQTRPSDLWEGRVVFESLELRITLSLPESRAGDRLRDER